jgi:hypothetical protein
MRRLWIGLALSQDGNGRQAGNNAHSEPPSAHLVSASMTMHRAEGSAMIHLNGGRPDAVPAVAVRSSHS